MRVSWVALVVLSLALLGADDRVQKPAKGRTAGSSVTTDSPEGAAARIKADVVKWRDVISKAGIQ